MIQNYTRYWSWCIVAKHRQLISTARKLNLGSNESANDNQFNLVPLELCDYLATLPFWCGNRKLHLKNTDYQHVARCCTTHIVGLPRHPATNHEMPLTPFQIDFAKKVIDGRLNFGDAIQQMRKPLLIHLNKGRQMGFTEIVLRIILHLSFTRYAGCLLYTSPSPRDRS